MPDLMKYPRLLCGALALLIGMPLYANNPDTDRADHDFDSPHPNNVRGSLIKARDAGDRALNKLDHGLHDGAHDVRQKLDKKKSSDKK